MSKPADLNRPIIESLYAEALLLADNVRASFDFAGRIDTMVEDEDDYDDGESLPPADDSYGGMDIGSDDPLPDADDFASVLQIKRPKKAGKRGKARRSALDDGRRAAFTLRLDSHRHLKLRLACTVRNRSAQQIVTEALDRLIDAMPEIESLAAQVKRH